MLRLIWKGVTSDSAAYLWLGLNVVAAFLNTGNLAGLFNAFVAGLMAGVMVFKKALDYAERQS